MRAPEPVLVDPTRGHIRTGELVFCDLGPTLEVWSYTGATLDPQTACHLGSALLAWAAKKGTVRA